LAVVEHQARRACSRASSRTVDKLAVGAVMREPVSTGYFGIPLSFGSSLQPYKRAALGNCGDFCI